MELELKEYLQVIRKRLWMMIIIVLTASLVAAIVSFYFIKPVYEANTKLIVNKSSDFVGLSSVDFNMLQANIRLINTYKDIIKTPAILDKVTSTYPEIGLTSDQLNDKITVQTTTDSQVMTINAQDYSQEKAVMIVNAVASVFQKEIPSIMKVDNVAILNEAKAESHPKPVKPNKLLNIVIAFVVSLMLSVGLAFFLEYLDDTIKNERDIEQYLGVPNLGNIIRIKQNDLKSRSQSSQRAVGGETTYASLNQ